jgi:hypothetical protein
MVAPPMRSRVVAVLVSVALFFMLAAQAFPQVAQNEAEKTPAVVNAHASAPGFMEQAGSSEKASKKSSGFLPSLLGLAVAGAVIAILVLTVFKKKGYAPHIIPPNFGRDFSNLYFPLLAGEIRKYTVSEGTSRAAMTVDTTVQIKQLMGILCLGVHERVITDERLVEDTWRWYAQDHDGNIWYFARETKKYDYQLLIEDWSWQAGKNDAKPGLAMPNRPQDYLNKEYRQNYAPGVEEIKAQVVGVNETVTVPMGTFSGCVKVRVYSDLQPGQAQEQYFAPGWGLVLCEALPLGNRRVELVSLSANSQ